MRSATIAYLLLIRSLFAQEQAIDSILFNREETDSTTNDYLIVTNRPIYETVQERSTSGITESFTYGLDRLIRKPATGSAQFYLHDRIGSVRLITDPAANLTETLGYDAFGAQQ